MSLRFHTDAISVRFHFGFTLIPLQLHVDASSASLVHFDCTSPHIRKTENVADAQGRREGSGIAKGNGKGGARLFISNSTWQPNRAHARTNEPNETKRIPKLVHPPTSVDDFPYFVLLVWSCSLVCGTFSILLLAMF